MESGLDNSMLRLSGVSKRFGRRPVLNALDLQVRRDEIVGLLGPNGSGKTTTLRVAAGVAWCDSGVVELDGQKVSPDRPESRQGIGYMPERVPLYQALRVERQLRFVAELRGLRKRHAQDAVETVIARLRLEPVRRQIVGRLSKGFRQRVGLAQTMLGDPRVLLLDEPTSGLDPFQIIEAREFILDMAKGRAVVVSTHIVQEMEALCSRVVYLRDGSLIDIDLEGPADRVDLNARIRIDGAENLRAVLTASRVPLEVMSLETSGGIAELSIRVGIAERGAAARLLAAAGELIELSEPSTRIERQLVDIIAAAERGVDS